MEELYKVYVKLNELGQITAINSNAFLDNVEGWLEIDSGYGDKYLHAQGNYLPSFLMDSYSRYNYKLEGGAIKAIPEEEKPVVEEPEPQVPIADRVAELETALTLLLEGATE